jgi:hypothetical protein
LFRLEVFSPQEQMNFLTQRDQLRHMAPVHIQGINLRGMLQFPVARYRNRLILEAPSRARQRANATTGDAHQSQETIDSAGESDETIKKLGVTHPSGVECASQSVCPRWEDTP